LELMEQLELERDWNPLFQYKIFNVKWVRGAVPYN